MNVAIINAFSNFYAQNGSTNFVIVVLNKNLHYHLAICIVFIQRDTWKISFTIKHFGIDTSLLFGLCVGRN